MCGDIHWFLVAHLISGAIMKPMIDSCPYCGCDSASTVVTEKYDLTVDFNGVPYWTSDNKVVSGGKRFLCDNCGKDVSKFIPRPEIMK